MDSDQGELRFLERFTERLYGMRLALALAVLAFLLALPSVFLNEVPDSDCASRYAPMAEAFASGDWDYAFHPRIPPFFPVLAGCVSAVFGVSGFFAAKLASAIVFALAAIPLYGFLDELFDRRTAFLGAVLYVFCPPLLKLAGQGLRDPARGLFLFIAAYGVVVFLKGRLWLGSAVCALGAAGLALAKGDCLALSALALGLLLVFEFLPALRERRFVFPLKSFCAGLLFLAAVSPWVAYEAFKTGYPVTELRQAKLIAKSLSLLGVKAAESSPPQTAQSAPAISQVEQASDVQSVPPKPASDVSSVRLQPAPYAFTAPTLSRSVLSDFAESLAKGLFLPFALLALPSLLWRVWRREFSIGEISLLVLFGGNLAFTIAQILVADGTLYVSSRYLVTACPLYFGWTALSLLAVSDAVAARYPGVSKLLPPLLAVSLAFLAVWGWTRLLPHGSKAKLKSEEVRAISLCAAWLDSSRELSSASGSPRVWTVEDYVSGLRPVVLDRNPKVSGLARMGFANALDGLGRLESFCAERQVSFVVLREDDQALKSELSSACFVLLERFQGQGVALSVWGFKRNLTPPGAER